MKNGGAMEFWLLRNPIQINIICRYLLLES